VRSMHVADAVRDDLVGELVELERDVVERADREATLLGNSPPGVAMYAIARHAELVHARLAVHAIDTPSDAHRWFSRIRRLAHELDRVIRLERSYRAVIGVVRASLDTARMLQFVARDRAELSLARWCERLLAERAPLVTDAEACFRWFVDRRAPSARRAARPVR